jgi:RNA polymerase subunit RPABC4/transcription elongation factor Spt4
MIACQSCGKALEAGARICLGCGALTGVRTLRNDEPRSTGWNGYVILYIAAASLILLIDWFVS